MGIPFDLNDVNPSKLTGGDRPDYGDYHVLVLKVDHFGGRNNEMTVDYEVLAGTTPGQEAKVLRDFFSKSAKAQGRMLQLAIAVGMTTVEALEAMKLRGESPDFDFEKDAVGRQCCVRVEKDEYQGNERPRVNFGIWHVDDPKAANIPKHPGQLAEFRQRFNVPEPAGTTPAGEPTKPASSFFQSV